MSISRVLRSLIVLAGAAALITGCATSNPGPQTDEAFKQSMSEAETAAKGGQQDKAIDLYQQIAKVNPTRDEPWVRIAQLQFGAEKYPQAILAAEEALQRDGSDRQAKSILAVSGLRVSASALEQLRKVNEVNGSTRTEAESVAKLIRDALGEPILVPTTDAASAAPARKPAVRRVVRASTTVNTTAQTQAADAAKAGSVIKSAPPAAGGRTNPFGALQ